MLSWSAVPDHPKLVLAYLDPISWLASLQILGGCIGWLVMRWKRLTKSHGSAPAAPSEIHALDHKTAVHQLGQQTPYARLTLVIEGPRDWPFLEPIVRAICERELVLDLWCLSASELPWPGLIQLGRFVRTACAMNMVEWKRLVASVSQGTVLTTLTDLGDPVFPKARGDVLYVYAFHSLVSTHAVYKEAAFDAYDVILCAHESHVKEIRARELAIGLTPKLLVEAGYPYVDELKARWRGSQARLAKTVLIAPSWGADDHLEITWPAAIEAFAQAGWRVIFRPHPESLKRAGRKLKAIRAICDLWPNVEFDDGAATGVHLPCATCLISDWSGAALEFALAAQLPVGFVDTPQKVRNINWEKLGLPTVEADIRHGLGPVVDPSDVHILPGLMEAAEGTRRISSAAPFNPDRSAVIAANAVVATLRANAA